MPDPEIAAICREQAAADRAAAQLPELPALDDECSTCQGNGVETAPGWLAWYEREKAAKAAWEAANPGRSWFSSSEYQAIDDEQPEPEMRCRTCRGAGYVPTAAGRQVLDFLRRHEAG